MIFFVFTYPSFALLTIGSICYVRKKIYIKNDKVYFRLTKPSVPHPTINSTYRVS